MRQTYFQTIGVKLDFFEAFFKFFVHLISPQIYGQEWVLPWPSQGLDDGAPPKEDGGLFLHREVLTQGHVAAARQEVHPGDECTVVEGPEVQRMQQLVDWVDGGLPQVQQVFLVRDVRPTSPLSRLRVSHCPIPHDVPELLRQIQLPLHPGGVKPVVGTDGDRGQDIVLCDLAERLHCCGVPPEVLPYLVIGKMCLS